MSRQELNLGILAHVDAGKTTLTERLLYEAGVIDAIGRVDDGTTQTDSLALERQRGITIRSAVASFFVGDVHVNLIDTPGHPDFIAEVERVLDVLDGAVLVVSAVEGVQPQTRILMRALQRLQVPTVVFVNKIDRMGADPLRVLSEVSDRLALAVAAMGTVHDAGTRSAEFRPYTEADSESANRLLETLCENDEGLLTAYLDDGVSTERLRRALGVQCRRGDVHPVFFGSAATGAGVTALMASLPELLPSSAGEEGASPSGAIFKIERGAKGEKVAYVRLGTGTVSVRDVLALGPGRANKVKAVEVFDRGSAVPAAAFSAGAVAKVWGLADGRVGDRLGEGAAVALDARFPPPTLEAVVAARNPRNRRRLLDSLAELAEQDPLINVRQDDAHDEISVSLYGEVQKEVIEATLLADYGLEVVFHEATTICVERPVTAGDALEVLYAKTRTNVTGKCSPWSSNPFPATLGLRVEPAALGSGIRVELDVDVRLLPLYIYKTAEAFQRQLTEYVRDALREGLYGWSVTDCLVTLVDCGYQAPGTKASDYRKLTPLVVFAALGKAMTAVCEPMLRVRIETLPASTVAVIGALVALRGVSPVPTLAGHLAVVEATLPAASFSALQRQLPVLTAGEGVVESTFAGYEPLPRNPPARRRVRPNPLQRGEYLAQFERASR